MVQSSNEKNREKIRPGFHTSFHEGKKTHDEGYYYLGWGANPNQTTFGISMTKLELKTLYNDLRNYIVGIEENEKEH